MNAVQVGLQARKIHAAGTHRKEIGSLHLVDFGPWHVLGPAAVFRLGILKVVFKDAHAILLTHRQRVHPRHGEVARVQHQPDIFRVGVGHDEVQLVLGLELAVQVGVNPEPHVQLFTHPLARGH